MNSTASQMLGWSQQELLEVDVDFVRDLATNRDNQHLVRAIVGPTASSTPNRKSAAVGPSSYMRQSPSSPRGSRCFQRLKT
jgi:hypothetical protein